jgi:predicted NBD/HSP70 family sugar kinase
VVTAVGACHDIRSRHDFSHFLSLIPQNTFLENRKGVKHMSKPIAYIGLDIGGTKCGAALGHLADRVHIEDKITFPTAGTTPDEVLSRFADFISAHLEAWDIRGIGIACGGPLDSRRGIVKKPPSLPLWDDIHVVEYFENIFHIPTKLRNDLMSLYIKENVFIQFLK